MTNVQEIIQTAQTNLQQMGVSLPAVQNDIEIPTVYSNIPDLGPGNIGDLMGALAAYISFLEYKVSIAETEHESWKQAYDFEKKRKMLEIEQERRDIMEAKVDAEMPNIINTVMQKSVQMQLLKAILEGKKRIFDSLSRELSRRALLYRTQGMGV